MMGQGLSFVFELLAACLAGLVAAICMTIFELPFWKKWGIEGVAEWQVNSVIVSVLIRKFSNRRVSISMSVGMHLFHGAALGTVFRVLLSLLGTTILASPLLIYAVVYSGVLWIISPYLTRSLFESAGGFRMTKKGLAVSFLAHNVYGFFLGLLIPVLA
jgi:hypothetical protein